MLSAGSPLSNGAVGPTTFSDSDRSIGVKSQTVDYLTNLFRKSLECATSTLACNPRSCSWKYGLWRWWNSVFEVPAGAAPGSSWALWTRRTRRIVWTPRLARRSRFLGWTILELAERLLKISEFTDLDTFGDPDLFPSRSVNRLLTARVGCGVLGGVRGRVDPIRRASLP